MAKQRGRWPADSLLRVLPDTAVPKSIRKEIVRDHKDHRCREKSGVRNQDNLIATEPMIRSARYK